MNVPEDLEKFIGNWKGNYRLHLSWIPESPFESETKALIDFTAKGRFLKIEYDWIYENENQEGLLLIGSEKNSDEARAFWIDSWHMSDKFMSCDGHFSDNSILMKGFYEVPNHPDWGWRIEIHFESESSFKIVMYNVSPENEEDLAVEAEYAR